MASIFQHNVSFDSHLESYGNYSLFFRRHIEHQRNLGVGARDDVCDIIHGDGAIGRGRVLQKHDAERGAGGDRRSHHGDRGFQRYHQGIGVGVTAFREHVRRAYGGFSGYNVDFYDGVGVFTGILSIGVILILAGCVDRIYPGDGLCASLLYLS